MTTPSGTTVGPAETSTYGPRFWVALAIGGAVMTFGAVNLVAAVGTERAFDVGRWLIGVDLLHDLVLAPLACLLGAGLVRFLPRPLRAPVTAGLIASASVLIVAYPAIRGFGRDQAPGNVTVQPLNYATSTLTVLAAIWCAMAIWAAIRLRRRSQ